MRIIRFLQGLGIGFLLFSIQPAQAQEGNSAIPNLNSPAYNFSRADSNMMVLEGDCAPAVSLAILQGGNVSAQIHNNGSLFRSEGSFRYEIPRGTGTDAIFNSGLWVGGTAGGELRMAAALYENYEFWAGPLDDMGLAPGVCADFDRIYEITQSEIDSYESGGFPAFNLRNWPTGLGAPTVDVDGNRVEVDSLTFEERLTRVINLDAGERPLMEGDVVMWWIMNDRGNTHESTDTPSIGLEVQVTAFAYDAVDILGNSTFYRYKLVHRGDTLLADTYVGIYADPNLGNPDDDFVGVDTTLQMGFVYNADNNDEGGYGAAPPALGYTLISGPVVDDNMLDLSRFLVFGNDTGPQGEPMTGENYLQYLQGVWLDGSQMTFGGDGRTFSTFTTPFMYPGDPEVSAYWSERNPSQFGGENTPGDRRFVMSIGPFDFHPGDIQELFFGIVWSRSTDYIGSVRQLKEDVSWVRDRFLVGDPAQVQVSPENISVSLSRGGSTSASFTLTNLGDNRLTWELEGPVGGFKRFLTVANGAGALEPPDMAAFAFGDSGFPTLDGGTPDGSNDRPSERQQVGAGRWGIHTGGGNGLFRDESGQGFVERTLRHSGIAQIGVDNYEIRFTATGSTAALIFDGGGPLTVPFELWNIGAIADPSDDYQMIAIVCEIACGAGTQPGVFDIGGDHILSGGENDPHSDYIYWYNPSNTNPGTAGYGVWEDLLLGANDAFSALGDEVMARMVLVNWNGGENPPYNQELPEEGTVFRIETHDVSVAREWLTVTSDTVGVLEGDGVATISLDISSVSLESGTYESALLIVSNDPARPAVSIPVSLNVLSDPNVPDIFISPRQYHHALAQGETTTQTITIANGSQVDLTWEMTGLSLGINRILTVANGGGPLANPEMGVWATAANGFPTLDGLPADGINSQPGPQQQLGPAIFTLHTGGSDRVSFSSPEDGEGFVERVLRNNNLIALDEYDYELRFTGDSTLAWRFLEDGGTVYVPFELWNIGPGTPHDFSDDYRMLAIVCEAVCDAGTESYKFDFGGDHAVSDDDNDPQSDWIYWYHPADRTPGEAGYLDWETNRVGSAYDEEVLARMVLVNIDGDPDADGLPPFNQELPEVGTVFRIETSKNWIRNETATTGIVPPESATDLPLEISAAALAPGSYQEVLTVTSNDPDTPSLSLVFTLDVAEVVDVEDAEETLPTAFTLSPNYPNPFNPTTVISYALPQSQEVLLAVYDLLGRQVAVLVDGVQPAGAHTVMFDAQDLPSGVYLYQLSAGSFRAARKMLLVR